MYSTVEAELRRNRLFREDVAKYTGVTYQTVSNRLNNKAPIPLDWAVKVKQMLNVDIPVEELFAWED